MGIISHFLQNNKDSGIFYVLINQKDKKTAIIKGKNSSDNEKGSK